MCPNAAALQTSTAFSGRLPHTIAPTQVTVGHRPLPAALGRVARYRCPRPCSTLTPPRAHLPCLPDQPPGSPNPDLYPPDIDTPRRDPDVLPPRYPSPGKGRTTGHRRCQACTAALATHLPVQLLLLFLPPDVYPPSDIPPDMPEPPVPGKGPFMAGTDDASTTQLGALAT